MNAESIDGPRAFQCHLVARMRCPKQIASALAFLDMPDETTLQASARRMESEAGLDRLGHGIEAYQFLLGNPLATGPEPGIEPGSTFADSRRHRFHLPLWSGFDFVVRIHRHGWAWGGEFIRKPGEPSPFPQLVEELVPWTILESEVRERFGPFASEDAWNAGKDGTYIVERAGLRTEVCLRFDYSLLQSIDTSPFRR